MSFLKNKYWSFLTNEKITKEEIEKNEEEQFLNTIKTLGDLHFFNSYNSKKYNKLNFDKLSLLLQWKINLPKRNYEKIKKSKLLFLVYSFMLKNKAKKFFDIKIFLDFGFKHSSIKYALKKMCKLGLIIKINNLFKLPNDFWVKKGEQYFKIDSPILWKAILINRFSTFKALFLMKMLFIKNSKKSKKKKDKKIVLSNNYLKLSKTAAYIFLNNISNLLFHDYLDLFAVKTNFDNSKHTFYKQRFLILQNNLSNLF